MNRYRLLSSTIATLLIPVVILAQQPVGQSADLRIEVLSGEDGVNIIKKKTAVIPVVAVKDKNNLPLAGIEVVVALGIAGVFETGSHEAIVITNANGIATVPNFRPTSTGQLNISVRATYNGQTAITTIHQTNFNTLADALKAGKTPGSSNGSQANNGGNNGSNGVQQTSSAASGGGHGLLIGLLIAGAAGGAVGAAYAAGLLGKSDSTTPTTTGTATTGTAAVSCSTEASSVSSAQSSFTSAGCNGSLTLSSPNVDTCAFDYGQWVGYLIAYCSCNSGSASPFSLSQVLADDAAPFGPINPVLTTTCH